MKNLALIMLSLSLGLGVASNAVAAERKINNPKVGGVDLDWCQTFGRNCGRPAADTFCKMNGYAKSISFKHRANIGYTRVAQTGKICNGTGCGGFKYIKCKTAKICKHRPVRAEGSSAGAVAKFRLRRAKRRAVRAWESYVKTHAGSKFASIEHARGGHRFSCGLNARGNTRCVVTATPCTD